MLIDQDQNARTIEQLREENAQLKRERDTLVTSYRLKDHPTSEANAYHQALGAKWERERLGLPGLPMADTVTPMKPPGGGGDVWNEAMYRLRSRPLTDAEKAACNCISEPEVNFYDPRTCPVHGYDEGVLAGKKEAEVGNAWLAQAASDLGAKCNEYKAEIADVMAYLKEYVRTRLLGWKVVEELVQGIEKGDAKGAVAKLKAHADAKGCDCGRKHACLGCADCNPKRGT